jgi:outer membrane protein assembly factor BamD
MDLISRPQATAQCVRGTGQFVTSKVLGGLTGPAARLVVAVLLALTLSACSGFNLFGGAKIKQETIVPPETLYASAVADMDRQYYLAAIETLKKLERQHPYSEYNEKAKLMEVYASYRIGRFDDAILAADRYMALFPSSKEMAYVLWIKGTAYFAQIKDATRDQQLSRDAIETYTLLINNYPDSEHAKDAREKLALGVDQLAAKEMSVGRYYLGNGQYTAAINRFKVVIDQFQTSTHIEEALYRLTEGYLLLGLISEAQTAAAVLGHNYPSSTWYKSAFELLQKQGLQPKINPGSELAAQVR